jgi:polar amino acid transport system substrate-binding protein
MTARSRAMLGWIALGVSLTLSGCGGAAAQSGASSSSTVDQAQAASIGDPTKDKLSQILKRGTLVLSNDMKYPPQSMLAEGSKRPADTKCLPNQLTGDEVTGYDVETGKALAAKLGVEACFVSPPWAEVVSGTWGDRWDIAYRSGAINSDRMTRLWMTQPYRSEPSRYFVKADSPYQTPADLSGKTIGACTGCSHELYLKKKLELPGITLNYDVKDPNVTGFDVEESGLKAVAGGTIDAFLCAETEGQNAIKAGEPLRALDPPAFASMLTGLVDKKSGLDDGPFVAKVNEVIQGLHADGTLKSLSEKFYGADYASKAGQFDLTTIGQNVT